MTPDRPPIVVLDTNVLLDWLVFADARAQPIGSALAAGQVLWRATAPMRVEFAHMLGHRSLERWAPDGERALACFDLLATLSDPAPAAPWRCRDPDDQMFIDLALHAGAGWLLTRDTALLALARRAGPHGICIVPPERWRPASALPD